jgi:salicylate hydroxylase
MIIGGGIGGLCLAHGLRQAGLPVDVYERTTERTDWLQGYRIHINPHGARALHDCLPPPGWKTFLETVATGDGGFGFITDQGKDLLRFHGSEINPPAADPADRHYAVSRVTLRTILLDGLDSSLHLGRTFERYEVGADRRVTAYFADGSTATADVLIGADGANSRVRRQLLPDASRVDTGVVTVAGKHRLTPSISLPPVLTTDANIVIPRGRGSLFTAVWQRDSDTVRGEQADYAFWGYADAADQFPANLDIDGDDLRRLVLDRMTGWSDGLRTLVASSDPASVNAFHMKSAAPVSPWPSGPVTLLGDAIHNMTPMAGIGANTALRDANLLRRTLIAAGDLVPAINAYEREMLEYGFAAVKQSLRNAEQAGNSTRLGRAFFRTVLRTTAAVSPMRRAMVRKLGQ